jgi:hypothetical protein
VVISTDSHDARALSYIHFGVTMARRGWLTAEDVINARPVDAFLAALRPKPSGASPSASAGNAGSERTTAKKPAARKAGR